MKKLQGSVTVEAGIWYPILIFITLGVIKLALGFWQESREVEQYPVPEADIVKEFYGYKIAEEIGKELFDDK